MDYLLLQGDQLNAWNFRFIDINLLAIDHFQTKATTQIFQYPRGIKDFKIDFKFGNMETVYYLCLPIKH